MHGLIPRMLVDFVGGLGGPDASAAVLTAGGFGPDEEVRWSGRFGLARNSRDVLVMIPTIHNSPASETVVPVHRARAKGRFRIERVGKAAETPTFSDVVA